MADLTKFATELAAASYAYAERVMFPNGWGVSIIRHEYSYGGKRGLFEVAVLNSEGELDFSSPITDDVVGWQTTMDVLKFMQQVSELPPAIEA